MLRLLPTGIESRASTPNSVARITPAATFAELLPARRGGRPSLALPSHGSAAGSRRIAANSRKNTQKALF
jgi:hypothetical protein